MNEKKNIQSKAMKQAKIPKPENSKICTISVINSVLDVMRPVPKWISDP